MRAKEYISATYELISHGVAIENVLSNLHRVLEKRGLRALHGRILRGLIEKIRRSDRTRTPKIILARNEDASRNKHAIQNALQKLGEEKFETVIDQTLIGGFIAVGNGKRVDQSHKSTLLHVYHKLVD